MVVPKLNDLRGVDFFKKYLNPFNCTYYYNNFIIQNNIDHIDLEKSKCIWYCIKIIFHGHEYQYGVNSSLFYIYEMSSLDGQDKFRGQIPYRGMFGRNFSSLVSNLYLDRILIIERLVECLKFTLNEYGLNLSFEDLYSLCEDICGVSFCNINYHYDFTKILGNNSQTVSYPYVINHKEKKLTAKKCKNIFKKNNIEINNIDDMIDDLNNIRSFRYDLFPIDFDGLNLSDDELLPKFYNTIEYRYLNNQYGSNPMVAPECLLKEFIFDDELEFKARYVDFLSKENKMGLEFWINHALKNNHIYDAKGYGCFQFDYSVDELKSVLRKYGLKVSGKKEDLIERIKNELSVEQINREFKGEFYLLTKEGKEYLNKNIHYTYMQPCTFTYKEYLTLCDKNPKYTPQEILCCLVNEDWITINNFDWKKYVKQNLNQIDENVIDEFKELLNIKIREFNKQNNFIMLFNNPEISFICPKLQNMPVPSIYDYWWVFKVDEGKYNWKYSYYYLGESGELYGFSLEDLKQQVISKELSWNKQKIISSLKVQKMRKNK